MQFVLFHGTGKFQAFSVAQCSWQTSPATRHTHTQPQPHVHVNCRFVWAAVFMHTHHQFDAEHTHIHHLNGTHIFVNWLCARRHTARNLTGALVADSSRLQRQHKNHAGEPRRLRAKETDYCTNNNLCSGRILLKCPNRRASAYTIDGLCAALFGKTVLEHARRSTRRSRVHTHCGLFTGNAVFAGRCAVAAAVTMVCVSLVVRLCAGQLVRTLLTTRDRVYLFMSASVAPGHAGNANARKACDARSMSLAVRLGCWAAATGQCWTIITHFRQQEQIGVCTDNNNIILNKNLNN